MISDVKADFDGRKGVEGEGMDSGLVALNLPRMASRKVSRDC